MLNCKIIETTDSYGHNELQEIYDIVDDAEPDLKELADALTAAYAFSDELKLKLIQELCLNNSHLTVIFREELQALAWSIKNQPCRLQALVELPGFGYEDPGFDFGLKDLKILNFIFSRLAYSDLKTEQILVKLFNSNVFAKYIEYITANDTQENPRWYKALEHHSLPLFLKSIPVSSYLEHILLELNNFSEKPECQQKIFELLPALKREDHPEIQLIRNKNRKYYSIPRRRIRCDHDLIEIIKSLNLPTNQLLITAVSNERIPKVLKTGMPFHSDWIYAVKPALREGTFDIEDFFDIYVESLNRILIVYDQADFTNFGTYYDELENGIFPLFEDQYQTSNKKIKPLIILFFKD